jgi:hypothetical protein
MNVPDKDILYIYRALQKLQEYEPGYPGLAEGIRRLAAARSGGTELAIERSWWEENLIRDMKEQEQEREQKRWMDEQPS